MKKNKKEKTENRKKLSFSSFLGNNRVIMIASIIIAFVLWIWVAIEKSPEVQQVITGVPVNIALENSIPEQLGLQIFGESEHTIDVTVTGKKYILSSIDRDDITVEAITNYVDSPGIKTLQLRVSPSNGSDDFVISSVSATYIEVFFDTYKEIEMALQPNISSELETLVPENCLLGDTVFSKGTVIISGPATEINRITGVTATASVNSVLQKTTTVDPELKIITNDGASLEYSVINTGDTDITMTIPVLQVVTLPTAIEFRNAPSYFIGNPLSYSVSPSSVQVAIPIDSLETTNYFTVYTVDFADIINSYNTYNIDVSSINSFKIMDDSVKSFRITINASSFDAKTVTVPASRITLKNNRADFAATLDNNRDIAVTLVGPQADIDAITADDVAIEVDTADKVITGDTQSLQGTVIVSGGYNCWATGKYDFKVTVRALE
ncbi:MAG: hypothetical protein J1F23_01715 [Oscillospiraceae bacterium]|nr:hypothetical protein [Oscillospiraceae bacterium]